MKNFGLLLAMISVLAMGITNAHAEDEGWIKDKNGCAVLNPDPQPNENIIWNGKCKNGYAEGAGTLTWFIDGKLDSTSTGTWTRGKMNGKGTIVYGNGERYDGGFANDFWSGKGIYTMPDGRRYEGTFVDGNPQGEGTVTEPNGKKYKESFDDFFNN
ncbi:MAG: hypothetical protein LBE24_00745 [Methylobacillus sp.]|jgi:hypothetical protein|nr:hypothetical protein [Methylobacillus sp.]